MDALISLFLLPTDVPTAAADPSGGVTGIVITVIGTLLASALTIWGKRWLAARAAAAPAPPPSPIDSATQVFITNLVAELAAYKTWASNEFITYRAEIAERDATIDYDRATINLLDDECLESREIMVRANITPPPRKPRPPRPA